MSSATRLINYVAYLSNDTGEPRIGHLNLGTSNITPLLYASGAPLRSLHEVIDIGENAIVSSGLLIRRVDVKLLPPIHGRNVLAVEKDFAIHVQQYNALRQDQSYEQPLPTHPTVFTKRSTSILADGNDMFLHSSFSEFLDYEGEIGVIIKKPALRVSEHNAWDYVWGFTIITDVVAKKDQGHRERLYMGKSPDTIAAIGPIAVPKEYLPPVLTVTTSVNGHKVQLATTEDVTLGIPHLIATVSATQALQTGDTISTGTLINAGSKLDSNMWLHPGDVVRVSVTGLGILTNQIGSLDLGSSLLDQSQTALAPPSNCGNNSSKSELVVVGSKRLFYQNRGSGDKSKPIYFVHGLGGSSDYFNPLFSELEKDYALHISDLEGHGRSQTEVTATSSISSFASDIHALCEYANIRSNLTIVAHSTGCLIATRFALDHPKIVSNLILMGPPISPLSNASAMEMIAATNLVCEKGMRGISDAILDAEASDSDVKFHSPTTTAARMLLLSQNIERYAHGCAALAQSSTESFNLSALSCQTLIVTGSEDGVSPPKFCRSMQADILNCEPVIVLQNVGHWHLVEDTGKVCSTVSRFLRSL